MVDPPLGKSALEQPAPYRGKPLACAANIAEHAAANTTTAVDLTDARLLWSTCTISTARVTLV
jgi:hypothetical protein